MQSYDVIVIGTGAGNIIVEEALKRGLRVAQIEKDKFGGTCLTRGCIPTKVLAGFADKIMELKELPKLGIQVGDIAMDWDTVSRRVWEKINESKELREFYLHEEGVDVYEGRAFFVRDRVLKVEYNAGGFSEEITADKIFIGAGARTQILPVEGMEADWCLTSESFFGERYPDKPYESLVIIGGGAIATEFAHIFNAWGTKVDIVIRSEKILNKEDEEAALLMMERFRERGIRIHSHSDILRMERKGGKKILAIKDKNTSKITELEADEILMAAGVRSNADVLEIEKTNISLDSKGYILTNEFLETSVEGVYAFGDINGTHQFRHKANYEADILAYNHFISTDVKDYRSARYDNVPAVTFTYPQVAHVGLSESEALQKGYKIKVGKHFYHQTAKGYSLGYDKRDGEFAKVIVDRETDRILGFHAIGYEASVLIQPYLNMMNAGETKLYIRNEDIASLLTRERRENPTTRAMPPNHMQTIRETMVPHPALSEVGIWTFYYLEEK